MQVSSLDLAILRATEGHSYFLSLALPIRHLEVGTAVYGGYEFIEAHRIELDVEPINSSLPNSYGAGAALTAELDDYDVLRITFEVAGDRKSSAALEVGRQLDASLRQIGSGVWNAPGIVADLIGDKGERSQFQLTLTAVPAAKAH